MKKLSEPKHGFWEALTKKARSIMEDDSATQQLETPGRTRPQMSSTATRGQVRIMFQDCICSLHDDSVG